MRKLNLSESKCLVPGHPMHKPRSPVAHLTCMESLSPTYKANVWASHILRRMAQEKGRRKNGKLSTALGGRARENGCYLNYFSFFSKIQKKFRPDKKKPWTAPQNDALIPAPSTTGGTSIIFLIGAMSDGNSVMHVFGEEKFGR